MSEKELSGKELMELYFFLFGEEPPILTTVSTENKVYKEMIGYCNLMGTPVTDEIVQKFFGGKYDVVNNTKFSKFNKLD